MANVKIPAESVSAIQYAYRVSGLTLHELAEFYGVSKVQISRIVKGGRKSGATKTVAEAFDVERLRKFLRNRGYKDPADIFESV